MSETDKEAESTQILAKIYSFLQLDSKEEITKTVLGSVIGAIIYVVFAVIIVWPDFMVASIFTVSLDVPMVIMIVIAAIFGPLAGFVTGFAGSLCYDLLFTQQFIALGSINLAIGIIGFFTGIPDYTKNNGLDDGKNLIKLILYTLAGFLLAAVIYLVGLLIIANQSLEGTLLYNFLPFFSVSLISLMLVAPVAVKLTDLIVRTLSDYIRVRGK